MTDAVDDSEVMEALGKIEDLLGTYEVEITPKDTSGARAAYHGRAQPKKPQRTRGGSHASRLAYESDVRSYRHLLARHQAARVDNVELLGYLAEQGRDFGAVSPEMESSVERSLDEAVQRLLDENLDVRHAADAIGNGARAVVVDRLEGRNDVAMPPLKPSTVRRKGHSRIGVESGALRDGITQANVRTRKQ